MVEMEDAHIEGNVTTVSKLWSTFLKNPYHVRYLRELFLLHPFDISCYYITRY